MRGPLAGAPWVLRRERATPPRDMDAPVMYEVETEPADPRAAIERLEQHIEALEHKLDGCRKFSLAARIAVGLGGVLLLALILGAIRFDGLAMAGAIVAVLGGIVVAGSNRSTAREAAAQLSAAQARRAELIGMIELRIVSGGKTLH